ncbi:MAG: hypothetical protein NTU98_00700 [Bacteroidetes bacterium]|nr:hypothetical protein [Bacteroidota bacterium]
MRKILSLIMAFYVLTLVVMPCVDDDHCTDLNSRAEITTGNLPIHQDQQDCCSPLCTCNCCGIPFQLMEPYVMVQNYKLPQTITYFYSPSFPSGFTYSIWEPPKA